MELKVSDMQCGDYRSGAKYFCLFQLRSKFWAGYVRLVHRGSLLRYFKASRLTLLVLVLEGWLLLLRVAVVKSASGICHALTRPAHVVTITIAGLNKGLIAMGALERFLLPVRFLMFDHVTELWR